jgi:hypothetical protein
MPKLNTASQINVKKINVVAREFGELRKAIIDSAQGGGNSAVEKLESISAALENNIGKTFDSINETLKANTEKLNASYEQFFEICKAISTEDTAPLESGNQVREEFVEKFIDSILVKKLGPNYGNILSLIETGDKNVVQRLASHINHQIMTPYTKRFNDIEAELEQLEKDFINRTKKQSKIIVKAERSDIISHFNTWAANPRPPLPKAFYFIENDVDDLRIKFTIKESGNFESRWIVNREGRRKYLFPNPNAFDLYYLDLYDMNIEKLKRSWLVAIKIIKPCEINADGVITEKGELEIL